MSLRVNTNMPAINSHRNLTLNNAEQAKTMESLSSGLKINRGADGPASLVISERLRAQTAGLKQAIDNSEAGVSLVQTAEAALDEVSSALINARQLAVHAANEAVNDEFMLRADQQEIDNILATVNRIAKNTQYGKKNLLDGSKGATGVVSGENLEFVGATQDTKTSGPQGYDIHITQAAPEHR
jgi:flagellin